MRNRMLISVCAALVTLLVTACSSPAARIEPSAAPVLFVCEHGNVKSLMAASYFNRLAQERGLRFQAISRGSAPDSTTVPPAIIKGLQDDGFDVSAFRPSAVTTADVSTSMHVVTIQTTLPVEAAVPGIEPEQWNDVPAASVDFEAARASLKAHVSRLVEHVSRSEKP